MITKIEEIDHEFERLVELDDLVEEVKEPIRSTIKIAIRNTWQRIKKLAEEINDHETLNAYYDWTG